MPVNKFRKNKDYLINNPLVVITNIGKLNANNLIELCIDLDNYELGEVETVIGLNSKGDLNADWLYLYKKGVPRPEKPEVTGLERNIQMDL